MSKQEKFAKYLATTLAVLLIIVIVGGITGGILFLTGILPRSNNSKLSTDVTTETSLDSRDSGSNHGSRISGGNSSNSANTPASDESEDSDENFRSGTYTFDDVTSFDFGTSVYTVRYETGNVDKVTVELVNVLKKSTLKQVNKTVVFEDAEYHGNFWDGISNFADFWNSITHNSSQKHQVLITVPNGFHAQVFDLDAGVGDVFLTNLSVEQLELSAGVGNINGTQITADAAELDGGTGNLVLSDCSFGRTKINAGVGDVNFSGTIQGNTEIDCGVGNVNLSLGNSRSDYHLILEKGLGNIRLDGNKMNFSDGYEENTSAPYTLDVEGGVGNITIDFATSL